ncbi:unnamed protein product [Aphanomyces euteiches]
MTCYLVALTVQNTSRQTVRYRLTVPSSKYFRVLVDNQDLGIVANPTRSLSPGLSSKFDVAFLFESADDVPPDLHDKILILAENSPPIEIPLVAKQPSPHLEFESLIDLGMVVLSNHAANISPEDDGEYEEKKKELTVTPAEGKIPPYSSTVLTFVYKPNMSNPAKPSLRRRPSYSNNKQQSEKETSITLKAFASIECSDISQNIAIEISGTAVMPQVTVSPSTFDFGECASGARVDMIMNIKNEATLPVKFSFNKIAQFASHPLKGRLDVLQSQNVVVSFVPAQLGRFQVDFY